MVKETVYLCFGPPTSSCDYSCLPGYVPKGTLTCGGDNVFSGGRCELDLRGSDGSGVHEVNDVTKDPAAA